MTHTLITGLGLICSLGSSCQESWRAIKEPQCGISTIKQFDTSPFSSTLGAELPAGLRAKFDSNKKEVDNLAIMATQEAIHDSGLNFTKMDMRRVGVCFAGASGEFVEVENRIKKENTGGATVKKKELHNPASSTHLIADTFGILGRRATVVTACSSGLMAVGLAIEWIRSGVVDVVITGGADVISQMVYAGFHSLHILSPTPCAPFDLHRAGISVGEGAGVVVIESAEHAVRRGANDILEIAGHGACCISSHMTAPDLSGKAWARPMELALLDASISPESIGYINTHGTATELSDRAEAAAMKKVFGKNLPQIPASSIKSMIGHCLFAAGAIEMVVTALSLKEGLFPPTLFLENPDPEFEINHIVNHSISLDAEYALCNSFGFGGSSASVILRRSTR